MQNLFRISIFGFRIFQLQTLFSSGNAGLGLKRSVVNEEEIDGALKACKTVAVVGISPKPDRPSYVVAAYLQSKGYRVIPVRPDGEEILGEKVYRHLMEIPKEIEIDVVDIFRKSEDVLPIVEEAIQRGASVIWMQEGIINLEASSRAEEAGLKVVMNRCMKKEYERLF